MTVADPAESGLDVERLFVALAYCWNEHGSDVEQEDRLRDLLAILRAALSPAAASAEPRT